MEVYERKFPGVSHIYLDKLFLITRLISFFCLQKTTYNLVPNKYFKYLSHICIITSEDKMF